MYVKKDHKFLLNETLVELLEPLKINYFTKTGMNSSYHVMVNNSEEVLYDAHVGLKLVYEFYWDYTDNLRLNFTKIDTTSQLNNK